MNSAEYYLQTWTEARTRFSNQLKAMHETDLTKKLGGSPNSAGFLIQHIAEVELLFAKNVFGKSDVNIHAKTVIAQRDTGEWTHLAAMLEQEAYAFECLRAAIASQTEDDWQTIVTTREFGAKTKAEALGRILSHTAYHAGQLAIVVKYGV
jgi:uncharacterized damage-inducible protein DinB